MCFKPVLLVKKGIYVGCGKCFECAVEHSLEWAYRITLEASLYEKNCMITLTYNDDNLPAKASLCRRHLTLFVKRLRKKLKNHKIRYFACGEYGAKGHRPHYHIIVFNYKPDDLTFLYRDRKGSDLYRSATIEELWNKGFISVGEVNFDSAKYCAIYLQKKKDYSVEGIERPYVVMSRMPGIGANALQDNWLDSDKIYIQGKYRKLPRYFLDLFLRRTGEINVLEAVEKIKAKRLQTSSYIDQNSQAEKKLRKIEKIFGKRLDINFKL